MLPTGSGWYTCADRNRGPLCHWRRQCFYEHAGPLLAEATRRVQGNGFTAFQFYITVPSTPRSWRLNVRLFRREREWVQVDIKSLIINVIALSAKLQIEEIRAPQKISVGQRFSLSVTVRYLLPGSTNVMVQVYKHADPLLVSPNTSLAGQGVIPFHFGLTALDDPLWWQLNVHLFRLDHDWTQIVKRTVG